MAPRNRSWLAEQRRLIDQALTDADEGVKRYVLDGTIGDALSFCWGARRQYERLYEQHERLWNSPGPRQFGLEYVDLRLLLVVADDTVSHVRIVERLLRSIDRPMQLSPDPVLRRRLRQARNLLAAHRDERALYRRLTGRHTPHVEAVYVQLGAALPTSSIDSQTLPFPGLVGGMLSLPDLGSALETLERELEDLAAVHRGRGSPPPQPE